MDYSSNFRKVMQHAKQRCSNGIIEPNHLLAGIILTEDCIGYKMLDLMIDIDDAKRKIEDLYKVENDLENNLEEKAQLSALSEQIMLQTQLEAKRADSDVVKTEHMVLTFVRSKLIENATYTYAKSILEDIYNNNSNNEEYFNDMDEKTEVKNQKQKSTTPFLDEFTTDYTQLAKQAKLDPVVGRELELKRIAQVLSRRKKNNPVLIGKAGVGKTAIVEGLAQNIINRNVPETLYGKRILALEMGNIVAGTKYRGEFEERMKKIVDELKKTTDVIVYIDEIHTMVGAGSTSGSLDAANILKPALSRGEISCIGSTTMDEYRKIEKDAALERRFQKIIVDEPTIEETRSILYNIKGKYEDYHQVEYTDEAIEACIKLSDRYISDRCFPDKAIDALDEAGSSVRILSAIPQELLELEDKLKNKIKEKNLKVKEQDFEAAATLKGQQDEIQNKIDEFQKNRKTTSERRKVTAEDIAEVVSIMTGIPSKNISQDDTTKLINLGKEMKEVVIGQDSAVDKIVRAVIRNKAGLGDTKRPIGTFMFIGPTGVGKTYIAKKLAEKLFNSERDMIRIDMSEYMEKHSVSRLVGAPPGYVGHEEAGQLTEAVRRKPYSIVLLDEIEKAHSDVTNILLQVFEDGILTDSQGKTVDFKNTVIIMTSNVGSREAKNRGGGIGFSENKEVFNKGIVDKALKAKFPPEFLNRIDDVISFDSLSKENIKSIIDLELNKFVKRLNENGFDIIFDEKAQNFLFEKGWDEDLGARPLKRAIQKYIEDEISVRLVMKELVVGNTIHVSKNDDEDGLTFECKPNLLGNLSSGINQI